MFTPQRGREVTKMYLAAAANTLGRDSASMQAINAVHAQMRAMLEKMSS